LVTGASGGLGKNLARELASRGFNVVLHGRSPAKLRRTELELARAYPSRAFRILVADASQSFEAAGGMMCEGLLAQTEDINLTVLINNAGGIAEQTMDILEGLSAGRLTADASVNALFPTILLRELIPLLRRSAPGLIINIGSLADLGLARTGSYSASKT
jgi:17beta-estradiol 17-dehydrogenase / very-long-chain 3-oxoacyl-CoA reductase